MLAKRSATKALNPRFMQDTTLVAYNLVSVYRGPAPQPALEGVQDLARGASLLFPHPYMYFSSTPTAGFANFQCFRSSAPSFAEAARMASLTRLGAAPISSLIPTASARFPQVSMASAAYLLVTSDFAR